MGSGIAPVLLVLILWNSAGASDPCRENSECRDSEAGMLACSGSCRARLSLESPVFPGNGRLQPLSEGLRRYVMGHFRWNQLGNGTGKREQPGIPGFPQEEGGGKRDPAGIPGFPREEGGKRSYSMEHFRWGKPVGRKRRPVKVYANEEEEEEEEEDSRLEFRREKPSEEEEDGGEFPEFPWDSRKEKRYGGFMSAERAPTPLVTLFRNAIGKSFGKEGQ